MVDTCSELRLLKLKEILQVRALSSSHGEISYTNITGLMSLSLHHAFRSHLTFWRRNIFFKF